MRFMLLVIPAGYSTASEGALPSAELLQAMGKFNEELKSAGVLLALDGLHPPSSGARVKFGYGGPEVVHGPFPEATEALGGYWILRVGSQEEAVKWASRAPMPPGEVIEVRRMQEMEDFG